MNTIRRSPLALDWREAVLATVTVAWLALIAAMAGAGSHPSGTEPSNCTIVSLATTQPPNCRAHGLQAKPVAVTSGAIQLANGRQLRIVPGWVENYIENSFVSGSGASRFAQISGWAASTRFRRPANAVLVFSRGRFIGAIAPVNDRPDIARAFHDASLLRSGFSFELPLPLLGSANGKTSLQLFAVAGPIASPMSFNCVHPPRQFGC